MLKNLNLQIYLIHNKDESRAKIMIDQFTKSNIDYNTIKWMIYPNKEDITEEIINASVNMYPSFCCGRLMLPSYLILRKGMISCSYKHYLCLKDMVEKKIQFGLIIEDNILFKNNISELIPKYIDQLNTLYPEWDILFDGSWTNYREGIINKDIFVYPKSNKITTQCHGGTKAATFYILTLKCAEKLFNNYLPINNSPDWHMNELFRKLDIKSYWIEPSQIEVHHNHKSTTDLLM
jgi:GR25 family glycosyltransferase involved in LPS biosynthesis